jgi:hypothetical protein
VVSTVVDETKLKAVRKLTLHYLSEQGISLQEWDRLTDTNDPSLYEHFDRLIERFRPILQDNEALRSEDVANVMMNRAERGERYRKLLDGVEKVDDQGVHISVKDGLAPVEVDEFKDLLETGARRLLFRRRGYGFGKDAAFRVRLRYPAATSTLDHMLKLIAAGRGTPNHTSDELLEQMPGLIDELTDNPEALEARYRGYLEAVRLGH